MRLEIGTLIYVGGCTGEVSRLNANTIEVSGCYYYSRENYEEWSFLYNKSDLEALDTMFFHKGEKTIWDASKIEKLGPKPCTTTL